MATANTAQELATYLRSDVDDDLARCLETARGLLEPIWEQATRPVPANVQKTVELEVAAEIAKRRESPSGSSQFADLSTGQPVRGPRDPLSQSWPIIRRYVPGF